MWARRTGPPASRAGTWARPCRRTRSGCARSAPPAARTPGHSSDIDHSRGESHACERGRAVTCRHAHAGALGGG